MRSFVCSGRSDVVVWRFYSIVGRVWRCHSACHIKRGDFSSISVLLTLHHVDTQCNRFSDSCCIMWIHSAIVSVIVAASVCHLLNTQRDHCQKFCHHCNTLQLEPCTGRKYQARPGPKKVRPSTQQKNSGPARPSDWKSRPDPVSRPTADTNQNTILQSTCWI